MPYSSQGEGAPEYMKDIYEDGSESPEEKESKENERLREFQQKAMELLELYGVVEQKEGHTIVDLEKIKDFRQKLVSGEKTRESFRFSRYNDLMKEKAGYTKEEIEISKQKTEKVKEGIPGEKLERYNRMQKLRRKLGTDYFDYFENNARYFLLSAFKDKEVITKQEFDDGKEGEKPLFYHPENKAEAFSKEKIKNANFHIGPWEIDTGLKSPVENYSPLKEDLDYTEVSLAAVIYNKNYGDGERKDGELLVRSVDYETNQYFEERSSISRDWVTKGNEIYGTDFVQTKFWSSPRESLEEGNYENLQDNDLLRPDDFEAMGTSEVFDKFGVYSKIEQEKGLIMIEGNRYSLGSEYADGNHWVASLGEDKFAILKSETESNSPDEVVATFDKAQPDSGYIGKSQVRKDLNLSKYEEGVDEVFLKRKPEENKKEYQKRLEQELLDFSELLELKKEVVRKTDVSLERLRPEQQHAFLRFYKNKKENDSENLDKIHNFVNTYEEVGLKSFDALEYSNFSGDDLLEIGKKPETSADAVVFFRKYNEVMERISDLGKEIRSFFKREQNQYVDKKQLSFEIADRASRILAKGLESEGETYEEIKKDLEEIEGDIITFTSIFKTAFKGKEEVDFEQVRGLDFEKETVDEIEEEDEEKMKKIVEKNYGNRGLVGEMVIKEFSSYFEQDNDKNPEFYILRKEDPDTSELEVVGFVRFDQPKDGTREWGSFNVDPDFKGGAIGNSLFINSVEEEGKEYNLEAVVEPDLGIASYYIEQGDFVVEDITEQMIESEDRQERDVVFNILYDKDLIDDLDTKQLSVDEVEKRYKEAKEKYEGTRDEMLEKQIKSDEEEIILQYDPEEFRGQLVEDTHRLIREGYVGTRYFPEGEDSSRYLVFEKKSP
ncbi:MAG: hypothetical protein ABEJ24_04380 [Candidatus Magasanikbacteria bacterium]